MLKRQAQGCFNGSLGVLGGGIGGALSPGVYPCNAAGVRTYFGSAGNYTGITETASYTIYWFEVLSDMSVTAVQNTGPNALSLGENTPILITGVDNSANVTMFLADAFTITTTPDAFSFLLDQELAALVSGDVWSQVLPSSAVVRSAFQLQYMGGQDTLEGDYGIYYQFTDPNGTTFYSTDNSQTFKWSPRVVIVAVDGNYNMRDALPDIAKSSVNVRYIVGLEVLTEDNEPVYDVDGKVIYFGDVSDEVQVAYALTEGINSIQITDVADDFGNLKDSDIKTIIATIPDVMPLRLLQARINDGINIWVDSNLTEQIGDVTITSIGDSPTTNTADFYGGIFTAPTGLDYSSTNKPTVGAVKLYNGDTSGIKMASIETLLTPTTDWTVICIDYVRDKDRGFPWSVGGSDVGSLLGIENEPATGKLAMHWFGNKSQVLYSQIANKTQTTIAVNDSVAQEFRLYIDGVLRWTVDTSVLTPTTNSLKFVRNARHATMTDNDVFTQGGWIEHIHTRVANYAFDANDAYAEYRNPNKTPSIQFMGDSVLAWSTAANYYTQVTNNLFTNNVSINFMRDAIGGSTFYESAPSDMTYKVADGGYVPDINSRPVGTVSGRPINELYAIKKFDACFLGYTGNYTEGAHNYIYGANGYNDQGYGEYLRAVQTGFKAFCDTNNIVFFFNSPQPLGNDTLASGTATRRTDIHYATMQQLVTLCGDDCLDTFATLATLDNKMPTEYTVDDTHLTDLGNDQLVPPIELRLGNYIKTAFPVVTKTNYTDGIVPLATPQPTTIEYNLDYGVIEARTQDFTLSAGENIVTITGVTPDGIAYSQDCPLYYGDLVSDPVSKWEMDIITTSLIEDSVGTNDITVFGTETITDGYWTLNYLNGDYGRIIGSNATMFPRSGSPFSYAVWIKPTSGLYTAILAGMMGATTPTWHSLGLQSDGDLERASTTNFLVSNIPKVALNQWSHVAWVTDGTNDNLWINGVKSTQGTLQNPSTVLDVLIGCKWNSDDPDSGAPTQLFNGSMKKAWYFDRVLIDAEVEYLYTNEL